MCSTIPTHLKLKPPNFVKPSLPYHIHTPAAVKQLASVQHYSLRLQKRNQALFCCRFSVLTKACSDGGQGELFAAQKQSNVETSTDNTSSSNDGYVGLFVRMLGLDKDPMDREQAIVALWKYSLGGKHCVDNIIKYHGIVNLIVNLLKSDSDFACEAAAGLLSVISSINLYRNSVAESSAVEEMTALLARPSLSSNVKEQTICALWNLSVDEEIGARICSSDILPLLVKYLEDEDIKVQEAAGGVLANLSLRQSNHKELVEAGVIPKLAKLLTDAENESKVIRKVARNALLELAKDKYNKILIMEEGLVLVPLIGAAAYKSFRPSLYSWPSLPDGTKIKQTPKVPSRYGASELLLGLSVDEKNEELEDAKRKAIVGRTQQQFLARIGAIETEDDGNNNTNGTLLTQVDAVARLVLILGLEDEIAIARAAEAVADACINEHMRVSFKEAGAIKHLFQLIYHPNCAVRLAVLQALDRLSISNNVCQRIEEEGVLHSLVNLLKQSKSDISSSSTSMILNILSRILDPNKELKSKFYVGADVASSDMISSEVASSTQTVSEGDLSDSTFLSCLVEILKTSVPDLQRKAASILEFIVTIAPSTVEKLISAGVESGLEAVFQQKSLVETDDDRESRLLELEEAGLAVSAASRLLTKLLDHDPFHQTLNSNQFTKLLRSILVSGIPLQHKDWVAASLVKLASSQPNSDQVNTEVTLHETIPRLIETINSPFSSRELQESAVVELNRIVSEGVAGSTGAVALCGGIFAVVAAMEKGGDRAVEACLAVLYNLSMDEENQAAIVAAGAVPVLRKIVLSERPQWETALRLLRTLPT